MIRWQSRLIVLLLPTTSGPTAPLQGKETSAMTSAILLIAHGSRRQQANDDLRQLAAMLAERCPGELIECAYLELAEPTIPQGMQACVDRGASRVRMLPYFLSAGAHVNDDLARYRRQFVEAYPEMDIRLCPPLGLHPKMIDILLERLQHSADEES
jgi:sirohydrochlorin ferrochelatase